MADGDLACGAPLLLPIVPGTAGLLLVRLGKLELGDTPRWDEPFKFKSLFLGLSGCG